MSVRGLVAVAAALILPLVAAAQPAGPQATDPNAQKFDAIQAGVETLGRKVESQSQWAFLKDVVAPIAAVLAALVAGYAVYVNRQMNVKTLQMRANEERAKVIQERLDRFYGPLRQLRDKSQLLYAAFKARQPDPENFRTLTALLDGRTFEGNDKVLLDEIIRIGEETEKLIMDSSGLVDERLQETLGKATTHYLVVRLAHKGELKGDAPQFEGYVFPRELDAEINAKIRELREELATLRAVA